ncbi:MAG: L-2-amino-thiazoline-4-carboxylic acid hydrolase [Lentisphaeria bacterium]|nr:L-2-amino-thiazoline-4-carboxylic acid hydrolase [Lentisphaeria bacterium]
MAKPQRSDFTVSGTGYRWEATLFLTMWEEIERRYGRDAAREISVEAMHKAGVRFGGAMADVWGSSDLASLKDVWETLYGVSPENEWDGKRFVVHGNKCIINDTFDMYPIPADLRDELNRMFCSGDQAFVEGFNSDIRFSFAGRILRGDPVCGWVMETPADEA